MLDFITVAPWLSYLFKGVVIALTMAFSAIVASKAGKNPYFALCLFVPALNAVLIWMLALGRWPQDKNTN
jgi:hypothetical protein